MAAHMGACLGQRWQSHSLTKAHTSIEYGWVKHEECWVIHSTAHPLYERIVSNNTTGHSYVCSSSFQNSFEESHKNSTWHSLWKIELRAFVAWFLILSHSSNERGVFVSRVGPWGKRLKALSLLKKRIVDAELIKSAIRGFKRNIVLHSKTL